MASLADLQFPKEFISFSLKLFHKRQTYFAFRLLTRNCRVLPTSFNGSFRVEECEGKISGEAPFDDDAIFLRNDVIEV